jgi:hypothetical protein
MLNNKHGKEYPGGAMPPNIVYCVLDGFLADGMVETPATISMREITLAEATALAWGTRLAVRNAENWARFSEALGVNWDATIDPASVRLESGDRALVGQRNGSTITWFNVTIT